MQIAEATVTEHIRIVDVQVLSDDWYVLKKNTFDLRRRDGQWQRQSRETYDRGNGATILLYDTTRRTTPAWPVAAAVVSEPIVAAM